MFSECVTKERVKGGGGSVNCCKVGGSGDRESKGKILRGIRKRRREEGEKEFRDETESV